MPDRRLGVTIAADAANFIRGLRQAGQATKTLRGDLDKLSVTTKANAESQVAATVKKTQRLRDEIVAYKEVGAAAAQGSREQVAAANLAARAEARLAASLGVTTRESRALGVSAAGVERDVSRAGRGALAGAGAFSSLGRSVAFASSWFLGGVGFVAGVKQSISAASDLDEQLQRTDAVFGTSATGVKQWSETSVGALGLSKAAALDASDTIGTLLQNVGLAPAKGAAMSETFVQLASDMAAFKKVDPSVALNALEAGLTGRTRSLKSFGLVIDATTIKAEALSDGILKSSKDIGKIRDLQAKVSTARSKVQVETVTHGADSTQAVSATMQLHSAQRELAKAVSGSTGQLTAQQRTLATYNVILKQTAAQRGAFAKDADQLAIKEQKFHAALVETEAAIGQALLPTVSKYTGELGDWLSKSQNQAKVERDVESAVKLVSGAIAAATPLVKTGAAAAKLFSDAVGGSKNALELLFAIGIGAKAAGLLGSITGIGAAATVTAAETTAASTVIEGDMAGIGTSATIAGGKVAGLRGALAGLNGLNIGVTIAIEEIIHRKQIGSLLGKVVKAVDDKVPFLGNIGSGDFNAELKGGALGTDPTTQAQNIAKLAASGNDAAKKAWAQIVKESKHPAQLERDYAHFFKSLKSEQSIVGASAHAGERDQVAGGTIVWQGGKPFFEPTPKPKAAFSLSNGQPSMGGKPFQPGTGTPGNQPLTDAEAERRIAEAKARTQQPTTKRAPRAVLSRPTNETGSAAPPAKATGVKPLTAAQQAELDLATNPDDVPALQAKVKSENSTLAWLKRRRASGKLTNAQYVQEATGILNDRAAVVAQIKSAAKKADGTFTLPGAIQVEQAKAATTVTTDDDVKAAKDAKAFAQRIIASGKLRGAALADAYNEIAASDQTITQAAQTVPMDLQVKQALAATTPATDDDKKVALEIRTWAEHLIKSQHLKGQALIDALGQVASANQILDQFTVPMKLQVAAAKAGITQTQADGVIVARQIKAFTLAQIKSKKLQGQALIDAYNTISQENAVIGAAPSKSVKLVSGKDIVAGMPGLTRAQKIRIEQRYDQAAAHGGHRPTGTGVMGQTVNINGPVTVHGVKDVDGLASELDKRARRRVVQTRGHTAGREPH